MELIDWSVFSEIVSMDQDEEGFALSLIETFLEQASDTMNEIRSLIDNDDSKQQQQQQPSRTVLDSLSAKGHYLKGSAAALGFIAVQAQCEDIQNSGRDTNEPEGFQGVKLAFARLETVLGETRQVLSEYFHMDL